MKVDIQNNGRRYTMLDDTLFREEGVLVPQNFITDFASVPKFLWWVFPPTGFYQRAALLHDFCYHMGPRLALTRWDADAIFLRQMKRDGVGSRTRYTMWAAVRLFGWACWPH